MKAETAPKQDVAAYPAPYILMPRLLRLFWLGLVLFAGLTALSTWLLIHRHGALYPYNNPVFQKGSWQFDFECFQHRFAHFGTPGFFTAPAPIPFTYPAPMSLAYDLFYAETAWPDRDFITVCILAYVTAAALLTRALILRNVRVFPAIGFVGTVLLFSYPAALQLFLANMEILIWMLVALGMWAYVRERHWSAAACFGLAAAVKIFPFVYFGLLLSKKRYKEIAFGALLFVSVTLLSLHLLGPSIPTANREIAVGLKYFQAVYVFQFHPPESGMDHSLFAILKLCLVRLNRTDLLPLLIRPYLLTAATLGILLYLVCIRHLPMFNQVLAIVVASVLLPPVSHDYTLLHVYTPFVLLMLGMLAEHPDHRRNTTEAALLTCFLLLFSSENYLIYHGIRFAGQVKAVVLVVLFVIALRSPLDLQLFPAHKRSRFRAHRTPELPRAGDAGPPQPA